MSCFLTSVYVNHGRCHGVVSVSPVLDHANHVTAWTRRARPCCWSVNACCWDTMDVVLCYMQLCRG